MLDMPVLEANKPPAFVSLGPSAIASQGKPGQKSATENQISSLSGASAPVAASWRFGRLPSSLVGTAPDRESARSAAPSRSLPRQLEPLDLGSLATSLEQLLENALAAADVGTAAVAVADPPIVEAPEAVSNSPSPFFEVSAALPEKEAEQHPAAPHKPLAQCVTSDVAPAETATLRLKYGEEVMGYVSSGFGVAAMLKQIQLLSGQEIIDPEQVQPVTETGQPLIQLGNNLTLEPLAAKQGLASVRLSMAKLSSKVRQTLGGAPLDAGETEIQLRNLQKSGPSLEGTASWYGPYFHGRLTANGETFDQNELTAAHKTLPFDTVLQVRNLENQRTVVVRINDRGPYIGERSLDLSKLAAQCLGSEDIGVIPYEAIILSGGELNEI